MAISKNKKISYSKLQSLLIKQPFLVWSSIDSLENEEDEDDIFDFDDFLDVEVETTTISQVQAKMFGSVEKKFITKYSDEHNAILIVGQNNEERYSNTIKALFDKSIDVLINPVFMIQYNGYKIIANYSIFSKREMKISNFKISTSTKRKDIIKFFYDYHFFTFFKNLFNKDDFEENYKFKLGDDNSWLQKEINDLEIIVLATKLFEKGEIDFFTSDHINTGTTSRSDSEAIKNWNFYDAQIKKVGKGLNAKGNNDEDHSIIDIVKSNCHKIIMFDDFKYYIDKIIELNESELYKSVQTISEKDVSVFAPEPEFKKILEINDSFYQGWSNKVIPKKYISENPDGNEMGIYLSELETAKQIIKLINKEVDIEISEENENIVKDLINKINKGINVWYDFEGFSLVEPPLRGILPFQQVVAQVSIITTEGTKKSDIGISDNFVYDTLNYTNDFFVDIINNIYNKKASNYIVFNRGYENARLKEMVANLNNSKHKCADECKEKVEEMINKTIDLADYFFCSVNKTPIITIPSLKGMYSIKKIEKFITEKKANLLSMEFSNIAYSTLEIKNGTQAMDILNNRALGNIGDASWKEQVEYLKQYCENDVKSMITVYYLIESHIKTPR